MYAIAYPQLSQYKISYVGNDGLYFMFFTFRQLEQEESKNKSEMNQLLLRVSSLREENRSLALRKTKLSSDVIALKAELQLCRQANR